MKFKVGDKVRVREDLEVNKRYGGLTFVSSMEKYCGQVFTVDEIRNDGSIYYYTLDETTSWAWTDEMLEPFNEEAHKFEAFLREVADGYKCSQDKTYKAYDALYKIVNQDDLDDEFHLSDEKFESLISYLVDFYVNKFVPEEDKPAVEMTLSEVEEALGHKVKIVEEELKPWI